MFSRLKVRTELKKTALLVTFVGLALGGKKATAYPNFIGYGYTTCSVCHYNTQGNGPLTDYGRALFSQEIAARPFVSKNVSDDELAQQSGFFPGKELPYWIRPSIKYRGLYLNTSPGGSKQKERYIEMQRDVNLVFSFDPDSRTIFSVTYGLLPQPKYYYSPENQTSYVSREHYLRFSLGEKTTLSFGLMDKVYGLRTSDHTAVNRSQIGFGQDDQVHGVVAEYAAESWTADFHLFAGNLLRPAPDRQKGFTTLFEYEILEKQRLGFSIASYENEFASYRRLAVHDRWGLPELPGSSLLVELGFKEDQKKNGEAAKLGTYAFIEATAKLFRGYSLVSTIERIQSEIKPSSVDQQRWSFGFLTFPMQRTEVRLMSIFAKGFSSETAVEDQQALQGQIHVSY